MKNPCFEDHSIRRHFVNSLGLISGSKQVLAATTLYEPPATVAQEFVA